MIEKFVWCLFVLLSWLGPDLSHSLSNSVLSPQHCSSAPSSSSPSSRGRAGPGWGTRWGPGPGTPWTSPAPSTNLAVGTSTLSSGTRRTGGSTSTVQWWTSARLLSISSRRTPDFCLNYLSDFWSRDDIGLHFRRRANYWSEATYLWTIKRLSWLSPEYRPRTRGSINVKLHSSTSPKTAQLSS